MKQKVEMLLLLLLLVASVPIDGSPPGSSIHGIFQARVLEWGAIAFSENLYNKKINKLELYR